MTVHQLLTPTIPQVDWDAALMRSLARIEGTELPEPEPPRPLVGTTRLRLVKPSVPTPSEKD